MNRLGATLLGGLIGAGAAMLLAPRSGEETRRRLKSQANDLTRDASGKLSEGRMRATELIRTGQERANELIDRGEQRLPETLERSRQAVDQAASQAERQVEEGYQRADSTLERRREETL